MKTHWVLFGCLTLLLAGSAEIHAQGAAVNQAPPANVPENYILSPSDIILVKVFEDPDLDSQYRISQDGTINFPLIGLIKVSGQSVAGAASTIRERLLKGYLRNPQVRVNVIQYAKRYITVLGQVQKPGSYILPDEQHTDLLQAIALAGGFTRLADEAKVLVRRNVNGVDSVIPINVRAQTKNSSSELFEVLPDDKITVRERLF
jgi:polysaccharide export outer membrane protein